MVNTWDTLEFWLNQTEQVKQKLLTVQGWLGESCLSLLDYRPSYSKNVFAFI